LNESYNGSSWTEVADLNTARSYMGGAGTQTSALGFGGIVPSLSALNESWNGSSWTEVGDLNTARSIGGGVGADNTSAILFGGNEEPSVTRTAKTEVWNGISLDRSSRFKFN
jgi:hypothetical protein